MDAGLAVTFLRRHWPWLMLGACALGLLAQPLWHLRLQGATDDWRWFHFHWEVSRTSLLHYGQLPAWNPYHCGGHVHLANPQTQFLSPLAWPALLLGVPLGLKLFLLLHVLAGFASMWWLAGTFGLRGLPRAVPAIVFCCSGFFASHIGGGHSAFLPFLYMPAVLAAFHQGLADARWLAAVAGLMALMVLEGGVYPVPYTALLLATYAIHRCFAGGGDLRPILRLAAAGGAGALLAGVKLVPLVRFLGERSRHTKSTDSVSVADAFEMLLSRRLERGYPGHVFVWPEYASYVGVVVLVAVTALLLTRWRRHRAWWVMLLVFLALMLGNHGGLSPWELLHSLPVFRSLQVPSRFAVLVTLCLAMLAGFAAAEAVALVRSLRWRPMAGRVARAAPAILILGVATDLITFGQHQFGRFTDVPRAGVAADAEPFRMTREPWRNAPWLPRHHRGTLACYEPNPVPRGKVRAGLASEAFAAAGAAGKVTVAEWSPNRVVVTGDLERAGLVALNQSDHAGWSLEGDGERSVHEGLPAARLGTGPFRVAFAYRPPGLLAGLLASLLGLGLVLLMTRATEARLRSLRAALRGRFLRSDPGWRAQR